MQQTALTFVLTASVHLGCQGVMDGRGAGDGVNGGTSPDETEVVPSGGTSGASTSGGGSGEASGGTPASGGTSSGGSGGASGGTPTGGGTNGGGSGGSTDGDPSSGGSESGGTGGGDPPSGGSGGGGSDEEPTDATCATGVWGGSTPRVLTLTGNTFAHDPTMIKVGSTFYRFWTGDYIPMATSTNLTHWTNGPSVYGGSYPSWVHNWLSGIPGQTFNFPWAPDVSEFNGRVHIYSSFSARFGDNISCITHLSTNNIAAGNWTDHGPILCTEGNENYNAIDADVALDREGTPWLAFGSFWNGLYGFRLNPDGSRADGNMTRLAWANQIEAPVLFYRCGYYYLFVTWGLCCPGEGRSVSDLTYRVAVGRSENIMGPYFDKNGTNMVSGGGTLVVQGDGVQWAAAGHSDVIVEGDTIYHFYHAYRQSNGSVALRISEMPFDSDGWPIPHGP